MSAHNLLKKVVFVTGSILFFGSCNLLHFHNVTNDFKWKNKKLAKSLEVNLLFHPMVIKDFDSSSTFKYFFEDSNKIAEIEKILKKKLAKRNFSIVHLNESNSIIVDSLIFSDSAEIVSVLHNDPSKGVFGDFEKNDIKIKVIGRMTIKDSIKSKITSEYQFTSEPREGFVFKETVAYTNAGVNLDKVMSNVLNEFSYRCYEKIENHEKSKGFNN